MGSKGGYEWDREDMDRDRGDLVASLSSLPPPIPKPLDSLEHLEMILRISWNII